MLLGGIKGKKNQTPNKAKQTNHQKTALWEVSGTVLNVLPSSEAWLLAERKERSRTHGVYRAPLQQARSFCSGHCRTHCGIASLQQPGSGEMMLVLPFSRWGSRGSRRPGGHGLLGRPATPQRGRIPTSICSTRNPTTIL